MRQEAAYKSQCGETLAGALTTELVTVNYPLKELPPRSVIATKYLDTSVAASTLPLMNDGCAAVAALSGRGVRVVVGCGLFRLRSGSFVGVDRG